MPRDFTTWNPKVNLGVTWEDGLQVVDRNGDPIDISGYDARCQFFLNAPSRVVASGLPSVNPVAELTTVGFYSSPPAWTVIEGLSVPSPELGHIDIDVDVDDLWNFSDANSTIKLRYSMILVVKATGYAIPVFKGKAKFVQAVTL